MQSGTSKCGGKGQSLLVVLAICFVLVRIGVAQSADPANQPAQTNPPAQVPAELPPAQPLPQAAITPTQAATGTQAKPADAIKDVPDSSVMTKLGAGDLVEVNVYNVPELTTKARVSNSGDVYLPLIDYVHLDGLTQEEAQ